MRKKNSDVGIIASIAAPWPRRSGAFFLRGSQRSLHSGFSAVSSRAHATLHVAEASSHTRDTTLHELWLAVRLLIPFSPTTTGDDSRTILIVPEAGAAAALQQPIAMRFTDKGLMQNQLGSLSERRRSQGDLADVVSTMLRVCNLGFTASRSVEIPFAVDCATLL